jgi:hypothetical protein
VRQEPGQHARFAGLPFGFRHCQFGPAGTIVPELEREARVPEGCQTVPCRIGAAAVRVDIGPEANRYRDPSGASLLRALKRPVKLRDRVVPVACGESDPAGCGREKWIDPRGPRLAGKELLAVGVSGQQWGEHSK